MRARGSGKRDSSSHGYPTATGAKTLRTDFFTRTTVLKLVNFKELRIFESAQGQHNMITLLVRGQDPQAVMEACITRRKGFAEFSQMERILGWADDQSDYFNVRQADLYEGPDLQIRLRGTTASGGDPIQALLGNPKEQGEPLGALCHVNQGVRTGADKVTNKHFEAYGLDDRYTRGA